MFSESFIRLKKLFVFLVMALMVITIGNRVLFTHVHILPDGTQVTHAHPFNTEKGDSQKSQHNHTGAELFFLANLEVLITLAIVGSGIILSIHGHILPIQQLVKINSAVQLSPNGRAPPQQ